MAKKNLPALPKQAQTKKNKKFAPVAAHTEEETKRKTTVTQSPKQTIPDLPKQEQQLQQTKAAQNELVGTNQLLSQWTSDPLILLTQGDKISTLEKTRDAITQQYGTEAALKQQVHDQQTQLNLSKFALEKQQLTGAGDPASPYYAADFWRYRKQNSSVTDAKYRYINEPEYRSAYQRLIESGSTGVIAKNNFEEAGLVYMTDPERDTYNYYFNKFGSKKADEYLAAIAEDLNSRRVEEIVEDTTIEGYPTFSNTLKLYQGYISGVDTGQQNVRHFGNLFSGNDRYVAPTAQQMASVENRQQMAEQGMLFQTTYDVATGLGQMTPSLLASTVSDVLLPGSGKILGAGMMGLSSAGGAYQNAINRGYTPDQARGYGILTGASEAGLGYLLSGIGKLGGKVTGPMVQKLVGKVDNALLKTALTYGGNALSELTEESLQPAISKAFENLALGTNHKIDLLSEETIYEGIVGAITSLFVEGAGNTFSQVNGIPDAQTIADQNLMFKTQTGKTEGVDFDRKGRSFGPVREASFKVMDSLARSTGKRFHVYESYVNQEGKRVYQNSKGQEVAAPNGFYQNGEIYVDLNAGETGGGTMLFTVAHELTHFIKDQSPNQFNALAEYATQAHGESKDALIQRQIEKAAQQDITLTQEEALEEVVADSMESMLKSGNVVQLLGKLHRQNLPLFQKVTSWLRDTTSNLRSAVDTYQNIDPETPEGKAIAQMTDTAGKLENVYTQALVETSNKSSVSSNSYTGVNTKRYSMRDIDIDRTFVDYADFSEVDKTISEKVADLSRRGKYVAISSDKIQGYESAVDWTNKKDVRQLLKDILNPNLGNTVYFNHNGQQATVYLTREGINHSAGGSASPKKAAAFDMFADLIKNAEYSHSSKNDEHSNRNKKVGGRIDWDYFVSVAKIGNEDYPVIFKIRSIDQDIRSQIYEITAKNETGSSHSDGHQESLTDVQPNYGGTPISDGTIPHQKQEVNEKFSLRSQITTPQQFTRWAYEAEAARAAYGDIDFGAELQNPEFVRLLQSGVGVKDAYFLSHKDELLMQAMHTAALGAEEKVNRRIAQNRARPRENGLDSSAAFITKPNISHMTKADRQSIARRVANGERIVF